MLPCLCFRFFLFCFLSVLFTCVSEAASQYKINKSDLVYTGAFRVPKGDLGGSTPASRGSSLSQGGVGLTFNPSRNSLFIMGHPNDRMVAEISIPNPIISLNLNELATSSVVQSPINLTDGNWDNVREDGTPVENGARPGGFLLYGNKLVGSAWAYYDASGANSFRSHFTASPDWGTTGTLFSGLKKVGVNPVYPNMANGGWVGGYMAKIPQEWHANLGGPALTGQGAIPIITRTSWGPSLWVFDPDKLGVVSPVPAKMLVGYPETHPTLGGYSDAPSPYFNRSTDFGGIVFPEGSRSILIFGNFGLGTVHENRGLNIVGNGDSCYGLGTSDISQARTNSWLKANAPAGWACGNASVNTSAIGAGDACCYDPANSDKGGHAYPYVYQVWAYDAEDLARVQNGNINPATGRRYEPWEVKPYAVWQLELPFANENKQLLGAAYDPKTQRIYVSQADGDRSTLGSHPLVHVFQILFRPKGPKIIQ